MNKLLKSKNRKFFGVCGGLATYLGVDASIIRILFVLGTIFTGSALFWIYILLAMVLSDEEQ